MNKRLRKDLPALRALIQSWRGRLDRDLNAAIERWTVDAAAAAFHLDPLPHEPRLTVVLGGTGAGKSTLINRMVQSEVCATSLRRTFTEGPVALCDDPARVPAHWLGREHITLNCDDLPTRGQGGGLAIAAADHPLLKHVTLIDTPDLDGNRPAHLAEADRAFRWAQAVVFVVSPEKYQAAEIRPYFHLSFAYRLPTLFVINKCEGGAVVDDLKAELSDMGLDTAPVFAMARDDSGYLPPPEANLEALRGALEGIEPPDKPQREQGLSKRCAHLIDRLQDQLLEPMHRDREHVRRLREALHSLQTPEPGVDVSPVTRELRRRMQRQSVLYLAGPMRVLDRVREAPRMIARLPAATWGFMRGGGSHGQRTAPPAPDRTPDIGAMLHEAMQVFQRRIESRLRSDEAGRRWLEHDPYGYERVKTDPEQARRIAQQELADLRQWLEQRWEAAPRDTRLLNRLLKHLPGGKKLTQYAEAAPWLLVVIAGATGVTFGGIDWAVIGGYTAVTYLIERLSNEVTERTRQTNQRIYRRFETLIEEQGRNVMQWLEDRVPPLTEEQKVRKLVDRLSATIENDDDTA